MRFTYTVNVEVERVTGKFAGRDEIADTISEALSEAIDGLDLTGIGADNDSEYEVTDSDVTEEEQPKPVRRPRPTPTPKPSCRCHCGYEATDAADLDEHVLAMMNVADCSNHGAAV